MEFKIVISDAETGKSYQRVVKEPEAIKLRNKKVGDELEGSIAGLDGYKLKVTGGSDKSGFPMKKGMHKGEKRILMKGGIGYRAKEGERKRKRVVGEFITENIVQINTKIVKKGKKGVEELLGIKKEEKIKEEAPVEKKTETKSKPEEEKPSEKKKIKESPKEVPKPEEKVTVKKEGEKKDKKSLKVEQPQEVPKQEKEVKTEKKEKSAPKEEVKPKKKAIVKEGEKPKGEVNNP